VERFEKKKANNLIKEKSPYLLQHAYNPVHWHPWGEEAFLKAREEDKPIFLSIGYSTCHWCHVMEQESFEDQEVADLLNQDFISIKVDREERPDLDQIYMNACQAMTGQGGWPLTVFITSDKKPFFAATYLPKDTRMGISGLIEFLPRLIEVWKNERDRVENSAEEITEALRKHALSSMLEAEHAEREMPSKAVFEQAYQQFEETYDHFDGGFGDSPKFPAPHQLNFLLRYWKRSGSEQALDMVVNTLKAMHRGGIFDQLGYGIHRYSVDREWLVPHFEKMLYDQATTAIAALEAYQASGDLEMAQFAEEIFSYVLSELTALEGGFYSAEDADSEGEEGTFYIWDLDEVQALLGPERGSLVAEYYGITEQGNFEKGKSILHRKGEHEAFAAQRGFSADDLDQIIEESRQILLRAREERERPFRDDKVITAWNGLMIAALARGAFVLDKPEYADAASRAAGFINDQLFSDDGALLRRYRSGEAAIPAFLEDYAFLVRGLIELFRTTFESRHLEQAERLTRTMDQLLNQGDGTMLFSSSAENIADLPVKAEAYDGAMPSGLSISALNYLQLGRLLGDDSLFEKGELLLSGHSDMLKRVPTGHSALLAALDYALASPEELIIKGKAGSDAVKELVSPANRIFRPHLDILFQSADKATAHYCKEMRCLAPVDNAGDLKALLEDD